MGKEELKEFDTEAEAIEWIVEKVDDTCVDNQRFAFQYDTKAIAEYEKQKENGCCGYADEVVLVGGVLANVGCNYGH